MKDLARCGVCDKEFKLKELKFTPWPAKNTWNTVGEQKYKFHCPHCNADLQPDDNIDETAKSELKLVWRLILASVFLMLIFAALGLGIYGLYILLFAHLFVMPMFYKMAKYKTRNVFGRGILKMHSTNEL